MNSRIDGRSGTTSKTKRKAVASEKKRYRGISIITVIILSIIAVSILGFRIEATSQGVVVIDPGHGGSDPGASFGGICEKDVNLQIALKTADNLRRSGYRVVITRQDDTYPELADRAAIANQNAAAVYVSIHCNSEDSHQISGVETYCAVNSEKGRALAESIHHEIMKKLDAGNRGVREKNFKVIIDTICPAVLVEVGYLSNDSERSLLADSNYQNGLAKAISKGIKKYM